MWNVNELLSKGPLATGSLSLLPGPQVQGPEPLGLEFRPSTYGPRLFGSRPPHVHLPARLSLLPVWRPERQHLRRHGWAESLGRKAWRLFASRNFLMLFWSLAKCQLRLEISRGFGGLGGEPSVVTVTCAEVHLSCPHSQAGATLPQLQELLQVKKQRQSGNYTGFWQRTKPNNLHRSFTRVRPP